LRKKKKFHSAFDVVEKVKLLTIFCCLALLDRLLNLCVYGFCSNPSTFYKTTIKTDARQL